MGKRGGEGEGDERGDDGGYLHDCKSLPVGIFLRALWMDIYAKLLERISLTFNMEV